MSATDRLRGAPGPSAGVRVGTKIGGAVDATTSEAPLLPGRILPVGVAPALAGRAGLVMLAVVFAGCGGGGGEAPEPEPAVEETPRPEPAPRPEPEPEPPPAPAPPAESLPGTLMVTGTAGASVLLDGELLGAVPGEWDGIDAGEHRLRVERDGHHPLDVEITIRGGRSRAVTADLAEMLGSIEVESDVRGATVFLDRTFKGNTPLTISNLQPGEYRLQVSSEAHGVRTERVEVGRAPVRVYMDFSELRSAFSAETEVIHRHRFGSCRGTLAATADGIEYRTDHKDAFAAPHGRIERFEHDYLENRLVVRIRDDRNYNFESPGDDRDALFVFHRSVSEFRAGS